ncbi:hypothetical protein JCM5350_002396 [Sporobolomyces pararoseus]
MQHPSSRPWSDNDTRTFKSSLFLILLRSSTTEENLKRRLELQFNELTYESLVGDKRPVGGSMLLALFRRTYPTIDDARRDLNIRSADAEDDDPAEASGPDLDPSDSEEESDHNSTDDSADDDQAEWRPRASASEANGIGVERASKAGALWDQLRKLSLNDLKSRPTLDIDLSKITVASIRLLLEKHGRVPPSLLTGNSSWNNNFSKSEYVSAALSALRV